MVMPQFAIHGFSDGAGPLSPHTYWWRDGAPPAHSDRRGRQAGAHTGPSWALLGITND